MTNESKFGRPRTRIPPRLALDASAAGREFSLMARGAATFKQSDLTRALKAAAAAGVAVKRIEIDKSGKIVMATAGNVEAAPNENQNDWADAK
jgi:hypothetical protein